MHIKRDTERQVIIGNPDEGEGVTLNMRAGCLTITDHADDRRVTMDWATFEAMADEIIAFRRILHGQDVTGPNLQAAE